MAGLKFLHKLNVIACQVLLGAIVISVLIDVAMRYLLNRGFVASGEFVPYLFIWFSFLAASLGFRQGEHFVVDVVLNAAGRARTALQVVIHTVELVLFLGLIYFGWEIAMQQMAQLTPYLGLPFGIVYLSVPLSATLMTLFTLEKLFRLFTASAAEDEKP
ncbi:TRAP transporter small permease [Pelagibius sp.]|uniref:TRAP transporter small permease n=1 Tax=Pelagibius sp. TaxID=1931238 RepID=UPI0026130FB7|nr:TRAP transporter small permease [Pelagibius sp.]